MSIDDCEHFVNNNHILAICTKTGGIFVENDENVPSRYILRLRTYLLTKLKIYVKITLVKFLDWYKLAIRASVSTNHR